MKHQRVRRREVLLSLLAYLSTPVAVAGLYVCGTDHWAYGEALFALSWVLLALGVLLDREG